MNQDTTPKRFTGYQRRLKTRFSVRFADWASQRIIMVGGIGTIIAVSTVCVYLLYVVLPLFYRPVVTDQRDMTVETPATPIHLACDEYRVLAYTVSQQGHVEAFDLSSGQPIDNLDLVEDKTLTAYSFGNTGGQVSLGYADGSIQLGQLHFASKILADDEVPENCLGMVAGQVRSVANGVVTKRLGNYRRHRVELEQEPVLSLDTSAAVMGVDAVPGERLSTVCAVTNDGTLHVRAVRKRENLMTGEILLKATGGSCSIAMAQATELPAHVLLPSAADCIYLVWPNGVFQRYDIRDLKKPRLVEEGDLLEDDEVQLTSVSWLIGRSTLLVGDSTGQVTAWFRKRVPNKEFADGWTLVRAHQLKGPQSAVAVVGSSQRTRVAVAGYENGQVGLFQVTTAQRLIDLSAEGQERVQAVCLSPKEDSLLALIGNRLARWDIDLKYPEASLRAVFLPVWYEGAARPQHVWQSSSGDDAFEPKLGIIPLIFGTLKATVYSLLFGVPLALLAAIYTSEFLSPRLKTRVKPTIELMASLPSVVLGFLAGLVIAPMVEDQVPGVLAMIVTIPFTLLIGAHLWQLLPLRLALRWEPYRLLPVLICMLLGAAWGWRLGPGLEDFLFSGDLKAWLDQQTGVGTAGWLFLLLPICTVASAMFGALWIRPALRPLIGHLSRGTNALVGLLTFLGHTLVTLALAWGLSLTLNSLGLDPRGGSSYLGIFVQRNALIVGFIMGFAIIPIIYTIAEDALSTVPDHLRAASVGAGATPWQTALRIVVPTAMSGLFSAIMIGLGRAVGETMILLMAAGNTPVMEWNIFNGMRTLAANIAVELPEAPQGGTHYRTLFLTALVLFIITFVINTLAEFVRQRFRKRAYQL
ncbi:ABC transporter permease [Planctomycetota bacterium]